MKVVGAYPCGLVGWLLLALPQILIADVLPDSSFKNWTGVLDVIELHDGSKLSEYSAQSLSRNAQSPVLFISFVPRFKCVPMVGVLVPGGEVGDEDNLSIEVFFGAKSLVYEGFLDTDGGKQMYSIAGSTKDSIVLRENFDVLSSVRIRVSADNSQSAGTSIPVADSEFSLEGSALSVEAAELHCRRHSP